MTRVADAAVESWAGRDLLTLGACSSAQVQSVLDLADTLKRSPGASARALAGTATVLLFEKPSLRTRVSLEVGIARLGGTAVYLDHKDDRIGAREAIRDYALNLERWVDCIVARTFAHSTLDELAQHASVPVVNALSDREHPCQALADLMTLREHRGSLDGAHLAFVGDGNNVCHALLIGCALLGVDMTVVGPAGFEPDESVVALAGRLAGVSGSTITLSHDLAAVAGCDAVYGDTWTSMGQGGDHAARLAAFEPYQINQRLMAIAGPDALFMHCLPASRGVEVTDAVIDGERSVVYDQAENRMHTQNALLTLMLTHGQGGT